MEETWPVLGQESRVNPAKLWFAGELEYRPKGRGFRPPKILRIQTRYEYWIDLEQLQVYRLHPDLEPPACDRKTVFVAGSAVRPFGKPFTYRRRIVQLWNFTVAFKNVATLLLPIFHFLLAFPVAIAFALVTLLLDTYWRASIKALCVYAARLCFFQFKVMTLPVKQTLWFLIIQGLIQHLGALVLILHAHPLPVLLLYWVSTLVDLVVVGCLVLGIGCHRHNYDV